MATRRSTRTSAKRAPPPRDDDEEEDAAESPPPPPKQRRRTAEAGASSSPPAWVHSLFSPEQREQWDAFLSSACLARVGADFYDLFELAHSLSRDSPLDAFVAPLGLRLGGLFELLARSVRGEKRLAPTKPLFLHGRCFHDPPEVTTLLYSASASDASDTNDADDAHYGYFRDAPDQAPAWVVAADSGAACAFRVVGSSLFHVLSARLDERPQAPAPLAAHVAQYLRARGLAAESPAAASRRRASQATAASLHGLGIAVPFDARRETGYRELPVTGDALRALLARAAGGDAGARKALSGLLTRATIANDECDFGTSLLLGLDVFAFGAALEKDALKLLRVAYMLLRRGDFGKIAAAHVAHRRAGVVLSSLADGAGGGASVSAPGSAPGSAKAAAPGALGAPDGAPTSSHVADSPKVGSVELP